MQAKILHATNHFQIGDIILPEDFKAMRDKRMKLMGSPNVRLLSDISSNSHPLDVTELRRIKQNVGFHELDVQLKMLYFFNPTYCYKFMVEVAAYLLPTSVSVKRVEEESTDGKMQIKHFEVVEDKRIPLALEAAKRYIATGNDDHCHQMAELTDINHSGSEARPIGLYAGAMKVLQQLSDGAYRACPARALFGVYMDGDYLDVQNLRHWMEDKLARLIANISSNAQSDMLAGINQREDNLPQEVKDLKAEIGELNGTPYRPIRWYDGKEELFPETGKLDDELAAQLPVIKFDSNDPEKLREKLESLKRIKAGDYEQDSGKMDAAVYNFGRGFLVAADAKTEHYDHFANVLAEDSGAKVDWHFVGGRAVFQCVDQNNEGTDEVLSLVMGSCERLLPQLQQHTNNFSFAA